MYPKGIVFVERFNGIQTNWNFCSLRRKSISIKIDNINLLSYHSNKLFSLQLELSQINHVSSENISKCLNRLHENINIQYFV